MEGACAMGVAVNRSYAALNTATLLAIAAICGRILGALSTAGAGAIIAGALALRTYFYDAEFIDDPRTRGVQLLGQKIWIPLRDIEIVWLRGNFGAAQTVSNAWGFNIRVET